VEEQPRPAERTKAAMKAAAKRKNLDARWETATDELNSEFPPGSEQTQPLIETEGIAKLEVLLRFVEANPDSETAKEITAAVKSLDTSINPQNIGHKLRNLLSGFTPGARKTQQGLEGVVDYFYDRIQAEAKFGSAEFQALHGDTPVPEKRTDQ